MVMVAAGGSRDAGIEVRNRGRRRRRHVFCHDRHSTEEKRIECCRVGITIVRGAEEKKQQRDCGRGIGGTFNPRFRRCGYLVELAYVPTRMYRVVVENTIILTQKKQTDKNNNNGTKQGDGTEIEGNAVAHTPVCRSQTTSPPKLKANGCFTSSVGLSNWLIWT